MGTPRTPGTSVDLQHQSPSCNYRSGAHPQWVVWAAPVANRAAPRHQSGRRRRTTMRARLATRSIAIGESALRSQPHEPVTLRAILQRLGWQTMHADYAAIVAVVSICGAAAIASIWIEKAIAIPILYVASLISCWLAGVFVFLQDQRNQSFRFFVQHREHPRL